MYLRFLLPSCVVLSSFVAHAAPLTPAASPAAAPAASKGNDTAATQNVVKSLINAIRYGKDDIAAKRLGLRSMAQSLMGPTWSQMEPGQRDHLVTGLGRLLVATSFPRGRDMFAYLDAILFQPAVRDGERVKLSSTIVVHRGLKKVEIPVQWVLAEEEGSWKVVDIVAQNESTCAGIREEEVLPLLQQGGIAKLLAALDERVSKLAPTKGSIAPAAAQAPSQKAAP